MKNIWMIARRRTHTEKKNETLFGTMATQKDRPILSDSNNQKQKGISDQRACFF
eukprot:CAMPEP_0194061834 /NCGR_PEP_ID=MMETSP0009_2-20130614/75772_1 /TAXON_ID=210454 /ORGANISM="Grammatophora oceanica, Strain CCMP 410" /LENGTH=53 /DNA_ID=CAMNT_0038713319 /DNA_START=52 /DNA_END=210 /DNA_ORIENTATION=-